VQKILTINPIISTGNNFYYVNRSVLSTQKVPMQSEFEKKRRCLQRSFLTGFLEAVLISIRIRAASRSRRRFALKKRDSRGANTTSERWNG